MSAYDSDPRVDLRGGVYGDSYFVQVPEWTHDCVRCESPDMRVVAVVQTGVDSGLWQAHPRCEPFDPAVKIGDLAGSADEKIRELIGDPR